MSEAKGGLSRRTLVEEGTQLRGSLASDCPIEVKGRIDGELTAPALTVSATGAVHGKVKVGTLHSSGELAGQFDAEVVQLSGSVKDDTVIRAKSLEVRLSTDQSKMQVVFGECELEVGSEPAAKEAAAGPATGPTVPQTAPSTRASTPPPADANGSSLPS